MSLLTLEEQAFIVGNNRTLLRQRLVEAKSLLLDTFQVHFKRATIDYHRKRLIAGDQSMFLQWKVRPQPDQPISPSNQQTSKGCVELFVVYEPKQTCAGMSEKNASLLRATRDAHQAMLELIRVRELFKIHTSRKLIETASWLSSCVRYCEEHMEKDNVV